MIDCFIPVAPKDYNKVKFLIDSIVKHKIDVNEIHICVPKISDFKHHSKELLGRGIDANRARFIYIHEEKSIIDLNINSIPYRSRWIYQQYLKLFQKVTSDLYITIDADLVFNKHLDFIENKKRIWYIDENIHDLFDPSHFEFQKNLLNIPREYMKSLKSDLNFFDRKIIKEILKQSNLKVKDFIEKSKEIITKFCYPNESEIYGQYIMKHYSDLYTTKIVKKWSTENEVSDIKQLSYKDCDIIDEINLLSNNDYDLLLFHSKYLK